MNTQDYILAKDIGINIKEIKIPKLSKENLELIEKFIEFTRHFQEINQLFRIFKINFQDILLHYDLFSSDKINRKISFEKEEDDIIIINSLVINYISSAKTLIESIECFIKVNLGIDVFNDFNDEILRKTYDSKFSYRLLIRLRDYAQHGHLPVCMSYDNRYSFDLEQILYTPHFDLNAKLKEEMENIKNEILEKYKSNPRILFVKTLGEFEICIFEIYLNFIKKIEKYLIGLRKEINKMVKEQPKLIYTSNNSFNGYIFYTIKNGSLHCFDPRQNPINMIKDIKLNLKQEIKEEENIYNNFLKNYKIIQK